MNIALFGEVLLIAVLLTMMLQRLIRPLSTRRYVFAGVMIAAISLNLGGLTAVQWLRSLLGDLSLMTWLVLLNILVRHWSTNALLSKEESMILCLSVALAGGIFYPLALGVGQFDPYRLGYAPIAMATLLGVLAVILWLKSHRVLATGVLLPLLAFNSGWFESENLWDFLLDPILFVYAVVQLLAMYAGKLRLFQSSEK